MVRGHCFHLMIWGRFIQLKGESSAQRDIANTSISVSVIPADQSKTARSLLRRHRDRKTLPSNHKSAKAMGTKRGKQGSTKPRTEKKRRNDAGKAWPKDKIGR